jgi:uncharacterized protein DUF3995
MSNDPGAILSQRAAWAGYAACAWAFAFAAISFYWAAGGTVGAETIGPAIVSQAHEPTFIAILWITGALKLLGGAVALALVQPWGRRLPRWILLAAAWIGGGGAILYGGASFVQHVLMATGAIDIPAGLGATAMRWHLVLWDPWWVVGGILFVTAAWLAHYSERVRGDMDPNHPNPEKKGV